VKSPLPAAFVDDVVAIVLVYGRDDRALVVAAAVALRGVLAVSSAAGDQGMIPPVSLPVGP
jgi:hypothetical protein